MDWIIIVNTSLKRWSHAVNTSKINDRMLTWSAGEGRPWVVTSAGNGVYVYTCAHMLCKLMNTHFLSSLPYIYITSCVCEQILTGHCFTMFENQHDWENILKSHNVLVGWALILFNWQIKLKPLRLGCILSCNMPAKSSGHIYIWKYSHACPGMHVSANKCPWTQLRT